MGVGGRRELEGVAMICVHDRTTQELAEAWRPLLLIHASSGPELSMPPLARCVATASLPAHTV